ncbi:KH domain-containing protein akap-1 [Armadillidium nasatum]|uniref:KH domain-containing protein akap-1 n=1 Tax=Armadillidium nasatum TaxID=96803 RepID=A0A5N5STF2_9CRUS|nr:KH domain-containing protein akap-1 [Armadillidium nasatum]
MKKNVLTILAVTGTFSVFYLLYKYKRRIVKKCNIEKPVETDADLSSVEKENILYKVYVNDSSVVSVDSGEENFYSDITNICKNSVTEKINLEERNNIEDSIAALYSLDFIAKENFPTAESDCIHLTELNMPKILNCSKNSEIFATYSCKDTQNSINNLLVQPDMRFLYPNGEDSSDITFLSPSIINTEPIEELVKEKCTEISKPQNGDIADINFVGSFNELNLEDLNSNVNVKNGKISPPLHLDNSIEGKQYSTGKLNKKFDDGTHENLSPLLDNVNDILNGVSTVTSVSELHSKSHLTNINLFSIVNGLENLNSATAFSNFEVNFDTSKVLNTPNLSNNEVKQESSNVTKSKRKRHRRKKKNSDSSRSSSSESNENSPPSTKLNVDEMPSKNEIDNKCFTNSSFNPCDTVNLNKNEGTSVCEKVSSIFESTTICEEAFSISEVAPVGEEAFPISEGTPVGEEAFPISEGAPVGEEAFPISEVAPVGEEAFPISEGSPVGEEAFPISDGAPIGEEAFSISEVAPVGEEAFSVSVGATICEETVSCMGTNAIDNYHIVCETDESSLFPLVPVSEPHNFAEEPQCLPQMNVVEANQELPHMNIVEPNQELPQMNIVEPNQDFQNEMSVSYGYDYIVPKNYVGRIIGKNGSYVQKVIEETNVKMCVIPNPDDEDNTSICELRGETPDTINACLKLHRDRLPSEVTMKNIFYGSGFTIPSFCSSNSIEENLMTIPHGVPFDLSVSNIETVGGMWIQQPNNPFFKRFVQMTVDMKHSYGDGSKIPRLQYPILKNTLAVCKLNDEWYRCLIERIEGDTACVKLLDIGGYVRYPIKHLRHPVHSFQYIPFQANLVYLWGLEPPSGKKSYPEGGLKKLIELVQQQVLVATVHGKSQHGYQVIKLYRRYSKDFLFINKYLVENGYASWGRLCAGE